MTENQSFYRGKNLTQHILGGLGAIFMIGLSLYLTNYYFNTKFPTGINSGGLCDINSFFTCDLTTNSMASNIAGVPISLLGVLMGTFVLFGFLFNNEKVEGTIHSLLIVNGIGCLVLFLYSLIALGGLCPACTLYYIASWLTLFAFFKGSTIRTPDILTLICYGAAFGIIFAITFNYVQGKQKNVSKLAQSLISQYEGLPNLGNPKFESDYKLAKIEGTSFAEAPIRIVKFSDFECPACRMLSDILHTVEKQYKGKVAIDYFFYPLDHNCNPEMTRPMHQNACYAAYMAACAPEKFQEIESKIFSNQQSLSKDYIDQLAKEYGVTECMAKPETKEKVVEYIKQAKPFGVKSTPTFILNGVKIEGVLPLDQLKILIDHLLTK
ncbi:MAG: hypothetical protein CME63_04730 [Halobacteriovoraceae bacterium]|nr:hypothetical protein [Halobacteriovoraceae bacterium]|tara:strand:- start:20805 stop:21947 length:1143 start_codon:yes stop_codon:yes gene_type:complete